MPSDTVRERTFETVGQLTGNSARRRVLLGAAFVAAVAAAAWFVGGPAPAPKHRVLDVTARSFAFEPAVLRVTEGDRITLRLRSADVVHGFYLDGHDIDATLYPLRREFELRSGATRQVAETVTFTASRSGKYRYRCSVTCGPMHPFMVGELIVEPNRLWPSAAAAAVALLACAVFFVSREAGGRHAVP